MNIKRLLFSTMLLMAGTFTFAYNPPLSGENLYNFTSPSMLSGETSVAGGSFFQVLPEHIGLNPALPAGEQRVVVNAAYTAMIGSSAYGQTFLLGTMVPSRFGVFSGVMQGAFIPFDDMNLKNSFTMRFGFSKDILDDLYVGMGVNAAFGSDWALNADIGVLFLPGTISWLPFMSDIRLGVSLMQLGKPFTPDSVGVKGTDKKTTGFPGLVTPKAGFAGTLFEVKQVASGISLDLSFPTFQNIVFDTNLSFLFFDMVKISTGWQFNLVETLEKKASYYPTASLSVKFGFTADEDSILTRQGLQENEIIASGAFKQLDNNVSVISGGAAMLLGVPDTDAPEIKVWEE